MITGPTCVDKTRGFKPGSWKKKPKSPVCAMWDTYDESCCVWCSQMFNWCHQLFRHSTEALPFVFCFHPKMEHTQRSNLTVKMWTDAGWESKMKIVEPICTTRLHYWKLDSTPKTVIKSEAQSEEVGVFVLLSGMTFCQKCNMLANSCSPPTCMWTWPLIF